MKAFKYILLIGLLGAAIFFFSMRGQRASATIAFYNVENLFDTKDDPKINDEDFLPEKNWTEERYRQKIQHLAEAISELGDKDGPELLGLSEVENSSVLKDLIGAKELKDRHYKFIHRDSKDRRGIDVALLYKPSVFKPFFSRAYGVDFPPDKHYRTRDILLVGGMMDRDTVFVLVNHWPSRMGGQHETEGKRITVARKLRSIIDSLQTGYAEVKLIVMGDFNDEPFNKSIHGILKADSSGGLFNPFAALQKEGRGSIKYKNHWEMIDQIIISGTLLDRPVHGYIRNSADIYDPVWLHYKENLQNGPYRTLSGSKYYGGYSDHFPVYIHLSIKTENAGK